MTWSTDPLVPPALAQRLIALRHALHRHPELAFHETRTAARLIDALPPTAHPPRRVAETGVVARIAGRDPAAPVVAIRGDVDALPIQEDTGAPFASETPGVMHACGHDVHAAWAVGAAHLLAAAPARGDVLIVLQPAEEIGGGAAAVLASGALDEVRAIFGAHVDLRFPVGRVVAEAGPLAAAADTFTVELIGRGGHAARPHEAHDPIVAAAALITGLQTIVARRLAPGEPAALTVGVVHAGTASNVIPDRARMEGTFRAVRPTTRETLERELRRTAEGIAAAHGVDVHLSVTRGTPPLINGDLATRWARDAVGRLLGPDALATLPEPNLGGEDFAFYLERMAGCFLRIGARAPGAPIVAAHTPRFLPDDAAVLVGAAVLAETARTASDALRAEEPQGAPRPA
jgi:hippurate hydrolase